MADTPKPSKSAKPAKPRETAAKPRSRAKKTADTGSGKAGGDDDLRARIAHRAYEISQRNGSGDAEANWLEAERELRGA
jgi:hypothetical protein